MAIPFNVTTVSRDGDRSVATVGAVRLGCTAETLHKWVKRRERDTGKSPGLTTGDLQRMKELEREVRELRRANEILRKASAFFAQGSLLTRPK